VAVFAGITSFVLVAVRLRRAVASRGAARSFISAGNSNQRVGLL
jgi:hypothetical protein